MVAAPPQKQLALFKPWPKQRAAMEMILVDDVQQILYGGAAGGGKSGWARMIASILAVAWPGSTVAIFRRTDMELQANHVSKWLTEVDPFVPGGRWFAQRMEYHWPSPPWCWCPKNAPCAHSSVSAFRHVDDNRGVLKYQGPEFAAEIVDEATHFKGSDIEYLYTRIRAPEGMQYPQEVTGPDGKVYHYPGWPNYRPLQALTANPGGVGHGYMRDTYIDPVEGLAQLKERQEEGVVVPLTIRDLTPIVHPKLGLDVWEEPVTLRGERKYITVDMRGGQTWVVDIDLGAEWGTVPLKRAFVPARLEDNPSLDPYAYAAGLAVGSAENRERLLRGDWSYAEDRVFKVISKDVHQVAHARVFLPTEDGEPGYPPDGWLRGIGLDHGSAKPTAVEWLAYDPDNDVFVFYAEYYRPGAVAAHVRAIREIMAADGHLELQPQADPQMWRLNQSSKDEVVSVAALYQYGGEIPDDPVGRQRALHNGIKLAQSKITDEAALLAFEEMVAIDPERPFPSWHVRAGEYGAPLLYFTDQCPSLFRELTSLRRPDQGGDGYYGEGIKNGQPDHCLAGWTIVDTEFGPRTIASLVGTEGRVWGPDGHMHEYRRARMTHRDVPVMRVTTSDGRSVTATPEHRFMLADGRWCELRDLEVGDRLINVRYNDMYERNHDGRDSQGQPYSHFSGREILEEWRVLASPWQGASASSCMGGPLWAYPRGMARPSQDRRGPQRGRGSRVSAIGEPYSGSTQWRGLAGEREEARGGQTESTQDEGMALVARGSGVARRGREEIVGRAREGRCLEPMRDLWHDVQDVQARDRHDVLAEVRLEAQLRGANGPSAPEPEGWSYGETIVSKVELAGVADTYNIAVEDVFSFSIEGGLVTHNSYDAAKRIADPLRKAVQSRKLRGAARGPRTTFGYAGR